MNSSVETRYPFLDEDVFGFIADLHPRWKLRGFRDKYLLRLLGERYLPREIAWRRKVMFRAPMEGFFGADPQGVPAYVAQLMSEDALRTTGWFSPAQVQLWLTRMQEGRIAKVQKTVVQLGMVGVLASQLWYHTFIESLADLPAGWQRPPSPQTPPQLLDRARSTSAPATSPA